MKRLAKERQFNRRPARVALLAVLWFSGHATIVAEWSSAAGQELLTAQVRSDSGALQRATATLRIFGPIENELLWSVTRTTTDGQFRFLDADLPGSLLGGAQYPATLIIEATGFSKDTARLLFQRIDSLRLRSVPSRIQSTLHARSPLLTLYLLLPAALGLLLALLNVTTTQIRLPKRLVKYRQYHPSVYALAVALTWIVSVALLINAYRTSGQQVIPLGLGDAAVPSMLVVASFLGSLTYIAYSIYVRDSEFFIDNVQPRGELLRVFAGRMLVAPYIAVIAFGILGSTFEQLSSPALVLFFGFFTGLWIKVVLETLNDIGKRLLSEESKAKISERLLTTKAETPEPARGLQIEAGDKYRFHNGVREFVYAVDRSRVAVLYVAAQPNGAALGADFGLTLELPAAIQRYFIYQTKAASAHEYRELLKRLQSDSRVMRVSQVLGNGTSRYSFAADEVVFELRQPANGVPDAVDLLLKREGSVLETANGDYVVKVDAKRDPFETAAALARIPEVEFAEPELVQVGGEHGTYDPTKCANGDQGRLAYDLAHVPQAWAASRGLALGAITIAVLDDGIDLNHKDLAPAIAGQFDCFSGELPSFPVSHDKHGTACAGLIAARPSDKGMQGVAFGARLVAIRVNHRAAPGGDIITTSLRLKRGIEAAVSRGADVLSLSWSAEPSDLVKKALERATTEGRNGRGCVVVAAAGNDGGRVRFPAALDNVIAVAGCDRHGKLIQGQFSSNFGEQVDVTAPALPMFTTALGGAYDCSFQGTSASTAIVAGAAALVLAANPELKAKEVRDLLIRSAKPGKDVVGGRNVVLKLLNVEAALADAKP
jgi:subtilisin family serine protease